jgi:hypothetical protein
LRKRGVSAVRCGALKLTAALSAASSARFSYRAARARSPHVRAARLPGSAQLPARAAAAASIAAEIFQPCALEKGFRQADVRATTGP